MLGQPIGLVLRKALVGFHQPLGHGCCIWVGFQVQLALLKGLKFVQPLTQAAWGLRWAGGRHAKAF